MSILTWWMRPENFRTLRTRLNLSQEQFARMLNVSVQTVSRWERGAATPSPQAEKALSRILYQKAKQALPIKIWRKFVHLRHDAIMAIGKEVHRGRMQRLSESSVKCTDCLTELATCYDHRDYSAPLDVEPVCQSCNFQRGFAFRTLETIWT